MIEVFLALILLLGFIALVSFGISRVVRARLARTGNPRAKAIGIATFVASFFLILFAIIAALSTIEWGR